jgi:hypothetical protein
MVEEKRQQDYRNKESLIRVYLELHGEASSMMPEEFHELHASVCERLVEIYGDDLSLITASKRLEDSSVKLSYRITFPGIYGDTSEVKEYVKRVIAPNLSNKLGDIIYLSENVASTSESQYPYLYVNYEAYDSRMLLKNNRPVTVLQGSVTDTLACRHALYPSSKASLPP